jgi:hypothetical protein
MPTETVRLTVSSTSYTVVADGAYNVLLRPVTPVPLRLHVGAAPPPANTTAFLPINTAGVSLSDLEGGDKVYLLAEGPGAEVVVIRGG